MNLKKTLKELLIAYLMRRDWTIFFNGHRPVLKDELNNSTCVPPRMKSKILSYTVDLITFPKVFKIWIKSFTLFPFLNFNWKYVTIDTINWTTSG